MKVVAFPWLILSAAIVKASPFSQKSFRIFDTDTSLNDNTCLDCRDSSRPLTWESDGNHLVEYLWNNSEERTLAQKLLADPLFHNLDIWRSRDRVMDIRLTQDSHNDLIRLFQNHGINPKVNMKLANVDTIAEQQRQRALNAEAIATDQYSSSFFTPSPPTTYNRYHSWEAIEMLFKVLAADAPHLAKIVSIGKTAEGRNITALEIGTKSNNDNVHKKTFVISSASHAREWITSMASLHFAHTLVDSYLSHKNPYVTQLFDTFDFLFIPVINVDGYIYSWEKDRLWKKNRQPVSTPKGNGTGIDINANYDVHFESIYPPTSDNFQGSYPAEAHEIQAMQNIVNNYDIGALVTLHSYGQIISYPFAYTCDVEDPDQENIIEASLLAAQAARMSHGNVFQVGAMCEIMGRQTGVGIDYAHDSADVEFAFQVELRDTGVYGYLLPEEQIRPACEETTALLSALAIFIRLTLQS